jgi:hypothetical protein
MRRVEIDWLKAIAGALAAVASAILLSTLGAAGTILGAAIGSLVVTIGSTLLNEGLATSKRGLEKAQANALAKVGIAEAEVRRAGRAPDTLVRDAHLDHAEEQLAEANRELDEVALAAATGPSWRERFAVLPWKHIAWVSAGLFVAAIVTITALELVSGRSVSSITGGSGNSGTTIGHVRGSGGSDGGQDEQPTPTPTPAPSETTAPSTEPSGTPTGEPTDVPTDGVTPSESTTPSEPPAATPSDTVGPAEGASE